MDSCERWFVWICFVGWSFFIRLNAQDDDDLLRGVRMLLYHRSDEDNFFGDACGAVNLKVEKIDEDDAEIEFSWRGPKNQNGVHHVLRCELTEHFIVSHDVYECKDIDIGKLKRYKAKWHYDFGDTGYYCAVIAVGISNGKRSNLVLVRTPAYSKTVIIIGAIVGCISLVVLIIAVAVYFYRKQKPLPFIGRIQRNTSSGRTSNNQNNNNCDNADAPPPREFQQPPPPLVAFPAIPHQQQLHPPGEQHLPSHPAYMQPRHQQEQQMSSPDQRSDPKTVCFAPPWDNPPPYTPHDPNPFQPSAPEQNVVEHKKPL